MDKAYQQGTIYGPGPDYHNWGVNVAWALAVTEKGIPIRLLSELDMKNIERSNPSVDEYDQPLFSKNPSAFALEIAIAKKMGYELSFNSGAPTLEPPTVLKLVPFTTGQPGYGVLPTKTWQLETFKECILRQLHHNNNFAFHVESVCTGTDNKAKQDLINTLQFMQKQETSVLPMLNDLSVDQCNQLKEVLKKSEFNEPKYDEIKTAVDIVQLQKIHHDGKLSTHILTICTGSDDAKRNLMDALCFLQKQESTLSVLNNLSLSEYNQLNKALHSFAFSGSKYAELKKVVGSFQKDKVYSICTTGGKLDKQQLLTTLNKNDNQFIIFNVLADRERKALLKVLTNDFPLGYNNLRSAVTLPSQPAVLFSSRLNSGRVNKKREREEKQNNAKPTPEEKRSFKKPRGGGNIG